MCKCIMALDCRVQSSAEMQHAICQSLQQSSRFCSKAAPPDLPHLDVCRKSIEVRWRKVAQGRHVVSTMQALLPHLGSSSCHSRSSRTRLAQTTFKPNQCEPSCLRQKPSQGCAGKAERSDFPIVGCLFPFFTGARRKSQYALLPCIVAQPSLPLILATQRLLSHSTV